MDSNDLNLYLLYPEKIQIMKELMQTDFNHYCTYLKKRADEKLNKGPFTVMSKEETPPSGDKHDFLSQGPYWWPNPETEDGLPYIRKDGEVNPEKRKLDIKPLKDMISAVRVLSLAYYYLDEEKYAKKAANLLKVWFLDEKTKMNPHLKYGQRIPGRCEGRCIGIIDTAGFRKLFDSLSFLKNSSAWKKEEHEELKKWFDDYLNWLWNSEMGQKEYTRGNNHGTSYDGQVVTYALFLNRKRLAKKVLLAAKDNRIKEHIEEDGRQPKEIKRTKGLSYSLTNLNGLFNLARLGEHLSIDLWNYESPEGKSLKKALEYLLPYISGEEEWPYQQIKRVGEKKKSKIIRKAAIGFADTSYEKYIDLKEDKKIELNLEYPNPEIMNV